MLRLWGDKKNRFRIKLDIELHIREKRVMKDGIKDREKNSMIR
jgi:hypothetical protein